MGGIGEIIDMELEMQRYTIESKEKWREIIKDIPKLKFKSEWEVKVIPPFGGALARFTVDYNGNHVSVYLDWYGRLGCVEEPYWELYPIDGDTRRYYLNETEELLKDIETVLENKTESEV